jgi:multicomponent Na+:H+ antiporter subunit G
MIENVIGVMWIVGSAFALVAALGVLRMPDVFTRMQASTKASTLGLGCLAFGAALHLGDAASAVRLLSIVLFLLLTTPVSAHVIARAAYRAGVPLWSGTVLDERSDESDGGAARTRVEAVNEQSPPSTGRRSPAS